jgi:hypothetical protein
MMLLVFLSCFVEEQCELRFSAEHDQCYVEKILEGYAQEPQASEKLIKKLESPLTRDFVYLELGRRYHFRDQQFCRNIIDQSLNDRCLMMVKRPHLQRKEKEK